MAEDSFDFLTKAVAWRNVVQRTSKDLPSQREASIAIDKLERMAEDFSKKFPWTLLLAMSAKQLRRKKGPGMRGLAQQSKRVDTLMTRLLVEGMRKDLPDLSLQAKRKLPALSQRFVEKLNSKIHESTKQIRLAAAPAESPKGLRKLARSSAKK